MTKEEFMEKIQDSIDNGGVAIYIGPMPRFFINTMVASAQMNAISQETILAKLLSEGLWAMHQQGQTAEVDDISKLISSTPKESTVN